MSQNLKIEKVFTTTLKVLEPSKYPPCELILRATPKLRGFVTSYLIISLNIFFYYLVLVLVILLDSSACEYFHICI